MAAPLPRVKVPETAAAGEIVEIKALISHPMESGFRRDEAGAPIPRRIVHRFSCMFEGVPVFSCDLGPGVAANPYFAFSARVPDSGTFTFVWEDDDGSVFREERAIRVI